MLIAQITDTHLGFDPDDPAELNLRRLEQVLDAVFDGPNRPDLLLVTGDLTDRGDAASYQRIAALLGRCPVPVHPCLGNHDDRAGFARAFPHVPMVDGFVQYCLAFDGLRLIVLDTLEVGRHGGGFCETRARWLAARLDEDGDTPTIIVMHHPPFDSGIEWMGTAPGEPWVERFAATIAGHACIEAILCGHLHRPIVARWRGLTATVCPSTAPQVALDLRPIDPERPDGRMLIVADPPGYGLHRWTGDDLISHFDIAGGHQVLAGFDPRMQPLIRSVIAERPI